ncbi:uncharacterized protein LOC108831213 isoform X2 [Raphanus sativus]|uniref:Uncharacterized protein LOC108831213 isoform X2 n=1 Tax=Raphanus sativus TaxID=3726 RepID=A0A9W3BWI0_RAPSA|nr:uncharacterized protein LOC108831213 isoform X2 [Raphanus sativus]
MVTRNEGSMRKKSVNGGGDAPAQTNPDDRRSTLPEAEAAGKRAVIKSADMKEDMQKEACALHSSPLVWPLQSGPASAEIKSADVAGEVIGEKNVVAVGVFPKLSGEEFDSFISHKIHGPTWHCILGLNFG